MHLQRSYTVLNTQISNRLSYFIVYISRNVLYNRNTNSYELNKRIIAELEDRKYLTVITGY